jgi:glycosyltransferase involved in cell wall biosynthesis
LAKSFDHQGSSLPGVTPAFFPIKGFRTATFSISAGFSLFKFIKENYPAVVYYRRSMLDPFPAGISRYLKAPLITELNENWEAHISETRPEWFWKKMMSFVEQKTFSASSVILCPSDIMRKNLVARYPHLASTFRTVYHGVNPELFRPISEEEAQKIIGIPPGEYLLWVGTPFWWSGMELLRKLAETLLRRRPACRILFVGDKEKAKIFTTGAWPENTLWAGKFTHEKMPLYYSAARALLAPYSPLFVQERGFPFKVLEALSCEKPVLITNGMVSQELAGLTGGITLLSEQMEQWEEESLKVFANENKTQQQGREGREGILRSGLTWENNVSQIHNIIEEVCE